MRYAFIERHRMVWPVTAQCRALNVSASGYHQHRVRQVEGGRHPQPGHRIGDVALLVHIKAVFNEVKSAYGWPRIWRELQERGIRLAQNLFMDTLLAFLCCPRQELLAVLLKEALNH